MVEVSVIRSEGPRRRAGVQGAGQPFGELVPGAVELGDGVVFEFLHHLVVGDAELTQAVQDLLGLLVVGADGVGGHLAVSSAR